MEIQTITFLTPLGKLQITGTSQAVQSVLFVDNDEVPEAGSAIKFAVLEDCKKQLNEYFAGHRKDFSIPVAPEGTDFQKKVWEVLMQIPYGKTISYGELANKLGDKNLMRAVGAANGRNPIAIIIPCHRVIGSGGSLTGYAGGLWRKKWLLDLENPAKQTLLF